MKWCYRYLITEEKIYLNKSKYFLFKPWRHKKQLIDNTRKYLNKFGISIAYLYLCTVKNNKLHFLNQCFLNKYQQNPHCSSCSMEEQH